MIRDGRKVYVNCERVRDVAAHPQFARNIEAHIARVLVGDLFHVSANTDPKGDRSKPP